MATRHDFQLDGEPHTVSVDTVAGRMFVSVDGGEPVEVLDVASSPGLVTIAHAGEAILVHVARQGRNLRVVVEGRTFVVRPGGAAGRPRGEGGLANPAGQILAPLAGVVVDIRVAVGDRIAPHDVVMVIEAMKMQNEVQAPLHGAVTAVHPARGVRVDKGDLLIEYDPAES